MAKLLGRTLPRVFHSATVRMDTTGTPCASAVGASVFPIKPPTYVVSAQSILLTVANDLGLIEGDIKVGARTKVVTKIPD